MTEIKQQVINDAKALHSELQRLGIDAGIDPRRCNPGGQQLAFYGVVLRGKTKAADVAKVLPELARAISQSRRSRTHLRFDDMLLRLEAEHPAKKPLEWLPSNMRRCKPFSAALGVSYHDGEQVTTMSLDESPQILVAGETGSGKTVLIRNVLLSMAYATSPHDLKIVLVDPKNEDLLPYKALPHTLHFAGTRQQIAGAIKKVELELAARQADVSRKTFRLLLVIDELAQLTGISGATDTLGEIMGIGRTKHIHVLACTQQPTEDGGMGPMMKANVPLRLIGAVSAGQSYTATRRKGAGADMLPGNGAFLYIQGLDMFRFQSYYMSDNDERHAIAMIRQKWGAGELAPVQPVQGVLASYGGSYQVDTDPPIASYSQLSGDYHTSNNATRSVASYEQIFPISVGRPLSASEAAAVRALADAGEFDYRGKFSANRAMMHVYGSRSPERASWIEEAMNVDSKIIRMRKAV